MHSSTPDVARQNSKNVDVRFCCFWRPWMSRTCVVFFFGVVPLASRGPASAVCSLAVAASAAWRPRPLSPFVAMAYRELWARPSAPPAAAALSLGAQPLGCCVPRPFRLSPTRPGAALAASRRASTASGRARAAPPARRGSARVCLRRPCHRRDAVCRRARRRAHAPDAIAASQSIKQDAAQYRHVHVVQQVRVVLHGVARRKKTMTFSFLRCRFRNVNRSRKRSFGATHNIPLLETSDGRVLLESWTPTYTGSVLIAKRAKSSTFLVCVAENSGGLSLRWQCFDDTP